MKPNKYQLKEQVIKPIPKPFNLTGTQTENTDLVNTLTPANKG